MPKSKGSKNNLKIGTNDMCCIVVVVGILLVGLYFLLKKNNMLGLKENFESKPMELNRLESKPNPSNSNIYVIFFYADWCPHW